MSTAYIEVWLNIKIDHELNTDVPCQSLYRKANQEVNPLSKVLFSMTLK